MTMKSKFDTVAWMRNRREEIDREDAGLSWDEKSRKTLELLANDPLWNRLKHRVVRTPQVSEASAPVKPR